MLEAAVAVIPRRLALALGALVGLILYRLGVHRRVVLKNFEHVGIWDQSQVDKILPKLYMNIGRYAIDFLRRSEKDPPPYHLINPERLERARSGGKGMIIVLAHFGNWELLAAIWGKLEKDLNVVAMPMRNPYVERWLVGKRTSHSVKMIYTENALRGMLGALKRDGIVAVLIDQHLGAMGTPAPFLGKTASTVRTVAGLTRKTGAAALPVYAILRGDGRYDIYFDEMKLPAFEEGAGEEEIVSAIQAHHNDILSGWIREYPEHWFGWFHKRFKGYLEYK